MAIKLDEKNDGDHFSKQHGVDIHLYRVFGESHFRLEACRDDARVC